jgi:hypothetical protein
MIMLLQRHIGEVEIKNAIHRGETMEVSPGKLAFMTPAGGDGRDCARSGPRPGSAGARGP